MLEASVGAHALVGEPLADLFGRDARLLGEHAGRVLVRVRIVLVLDEPLVELVDHDVREEAIAASTSATAAVDATRNAHCATDNRLCERICGAERITSG